MFKWASVSLADGCGVTLAVDFKIGEPDLISESVHDGPQSSPSSCIRDLPRRVMLAAKYKFRQPRILGAFGEACGGRDRRGTVASPPRARCQFSHGTIVGLG